MVITKIYAIVPLADVDSNMISEVYQESLSSLRLSSGGDKAIVSWRGSTPSSVSSYTSYSHSQILDIVNDKQGEWYIPPVETPNP